jgi:hypothetical protein
MAAFSNGNSQGEQPDTSSGPVGDGEYYVAEGDCIESIAFARGIPWTRIWDHPENAALKEARRDPNILLPGDRLFVPDPELKNVAAATDKRHKFRRMGAASRLRIRIVEWMWENAGEARDGSPADGDAPPDAQSGAPDPPADSEARPNGGTARARPRASLPYLLIIDGQSFSGQTDSDGWIDRLIAPDARQGKLILEPGTERAYETAVVLGGLDPPASQSGVCQRLMNLGFASDAGLQPESEEFQDAVRAFQAANGLESTGQLDEQTRGKLLGAHGS